MGRVFGAILRDEIFDFIVVRAELAKVLLVEQAFNAAIRADDVGVLIVVAHWPTDLAMPAAT